MTKYIIEAGTEVKGNINYEVFTTGEYELSDFVPCCIKDNTHELTCAFLASTVLGIDYEEIIQ